MCLAVAAVVVAPNATPARATDTPQGDDTIDAPLLERNDDAGLAQLTSASGDPLGLLPYPDEVRRYTIGRDVFEVWGCPDAGPLPKSVATFVADAEVEMTAYFDWLSDGRYDPDFVVGGTVPPDESCAEYAQSRATGVANGALFIRNGTGGFAGPGFVCPGFSGGCPTTYPANAREGYVGIANESWTTLAHEIGHMLSWPHSNTGGNSEYDNAIDLMSGNYGTWKVGSTTYWGSSHDPYATHVFNRYAAGWIDPGSMAAWDGGTEVVSLSTIGSGGTQGLVIDDDDGFFILGARRSSPEDPFPAAWNGIEVYAIDTCGGCWSLNGEITPEPPIAFEPWDLEAYTRPLDHVFGVGSTFILGDARLTVMDVTSDAYLLAIEPKNPPTRFTDVPNGHVFLTEIEWLAAEGITKGCNPPSNSTFCPDDVVTRDEMAAFLVRALGYPSSVGGNRFVDDDGSVFEDDIDRLAAAGVTAGCNPPGNDRYCPSSKVTRGQMAAFIGRALGYAEDGGGGLFADTAGSVFATDIDRLAVAGVTKGCNPPDNSLYCPDRYVTRGQMAAFLYRALG